MEILEFPRGVVKKSGEADVTAQYIDQMCTIYDHMDRDLGDMGQFILSGADLNDMTTFEQFDALTVQKAMERGRYLSIIGLSEVMNREFYHGLVRIAKTAGGIACEEEREAALEWALGSATSMVGVHINYIEPFVNKFIAGHGVRESGVVLLGKAKEKARTDFDEKGVHKRHFIHPDGDIADARAEREKVANHVRNDVWYDKERTEFWPTHMIKVVDSVRANSESLDKPAGKESDTKTLPEIVDRPIMPFKKIPKDARNLHDLLGALVKGDHVVVSKRDGKTTIELPTALPDVAKRVVSIVAAYRGSLDDLAARVQNVATEHPEIAQGDETQQALAYIGTHLETMRLVSRGGRGATRSWSTALR